MGLLTHALFMHKLKTKMLAVVVEQIYCWLQVPKHAAYVIL